MPKDRVSRSGSEPGRDLFTTIDDLVAQAEALSEGLRKLSQYKHPLDVRRGREVVSVRDVEDSRTVKASGRTYFLDVKKTREGKRYLVITESRMKGRGGEPERNSIMVFPEDAPDFARAVSEMVVTLD